MMVWKEIPGFFGYLVNELGEVKTKNGKVVKPYIDKHGYLCIRRTVYIKLHKAVMNAFSPENNALPVIRHLDGNQLNPKLNNLVRGTHKENSSDSMIHGTKPIGSKQKQAKLTELQVIEIKERAATKTETNKQISKDYPVGYTTINRIIRGEDWAHITIPAQPERRVFIPEPRRR